MGRKEAKRLSEKSPKKTSKKQQLSSLEKERKILGKIEKAKQELMHLQTKRKAEIGKLACKHGLDAFDNATLDKAFKQLANTLTNITNS